MQRFFLHLYTDFIVMDGEGVELADLSTARTTAIGKIRSLLTEEAVGDATHQYRIVIADESGSALAVIPFTDVVAGRQ